MALSPSLVFAEVMHARQRPRLHAFRYGVCYLYCDIDAIQKLANPFFSINRWNLFSFYDKDHGSRDGTPLKSWVLKILADHHLAEADGVIYLLTLPRFLGYVFNPVSFWLCFDKKGHMRAVISEVSNTFGEYHSYISYHDDHRVIEPEDWLENRKVFHVSPFLDVEGYYRMRFVCQDDRLRIQVDYYDRDRLLLATSVIGKHIAYTTGQLLKSLLRYPLVAFKVIILIHIEAVRLILKGAGYRRKPTPPTIEVTR